MNIRNKKKFNSPKSPISYLRVIKGKRASGRKICKKGKFKSFPCVVSLLKVSLKPSRVCVCMYVCANFLFISDRKYVNLGNYVHVPVRMLHPTHIHPISIKHIHTLRTDLIYFNIFL